MPMFCMSFAAIPIAVDDSAVPATSDSVAPNAAKQALNSILDRGLPGLSSIYAEIDQSADEDERRMLTQRIEAVSEVMGFIGKYGPGKPPQHIFVVTNAARLAHFAKKSQKPRGKEVSADLTFIKMLGQEDQVDKLQAQMGCDWDDPAKAVVGTSGEHRRRRNEL